jgi:hypothetical protein
MNGTARRSASTRYLAGFGYLLVVPVLAVFAWLAYSQSLPVLVSGVVAIGFLAALLLLVKEDPVETRMRDLQAYSVHVEDRHLVQYDREGRAQARINLDAPFEVSIVHKGSCEGVYRVVQHGVTLDFPSTDANAESIVKDCLRYDVWPPDAYMNPL